ncbi:uncharacterized protein LOC144166376 [Haemaphysalis longicornis]
MASQGMLPAFIFLVVSYPLAGVCFSGWCDESHDRYLEQVVESTMNEIPPEYSSELEGGPEPHSTLGFDGYKINGLHLLRRSGPIRSHCANGTQVASFDLSTEEPVLCSFHWTTGGNGSLDLAAQGVKTTTQLKFTAAPDDASDHNAATPRRILDERDEPVTTTLRTGRVTLHIDDPSGQNTRATAGFLRHLALAAIHDSWEALFVHKLFRALKEAPAGA